MKKNKYFQLHLPVIKIFLLFIIGVILSCNEGNYFSDPDINTNNENIDIYSTNKTGEQYGGNGIMTDYCGEAKVLDLKFKTFRYGEVKIFNDEDFLYINFKTFNNKKIIKINLFVGNIEEMPVKNNGYNFNWPIHNSNSDCNMCNKLPKNGCDCFEKEACNIIPNYNKFPIKEKYNPGQNEVTFRIPLDELDNCVTISARLLINRIINFCDEEDDSFDCYNHFNRNNRFSRFGKMGRRFKKLDDKSLGCISGKKTFIYLFDKEKNECNKYNKFTNYCIQECDDGDGGDGDDGDNGDNGGEDGDCTYQSYDTTIYAGQNINIGSLTITNDETNLYITFNIIDGWGLNETHVYVGHYSDVPRNSQNIPIPGQFPYKHENLGGVTTDSYTIPLEGLPDCYVIAAHAATTNGETAWSNGISFSQLWGSPRWGWVTEYCTQVCEE